MIRSGPTTRQNWSIEGPITGNRRPKMWRSVCARRAGARTEKTGRLLGAWRWIDGECYHHWLSFTLEKLKNFIKLPIIPFETAFPTTSSSSPSSYSPFQFTICECRTALTFIDCALSTFHDCRWTIAYALCLKISLVTNRQQFHQFFRSNFIQRIIF